MNAGAGGDGSPSTAGRRDEVAIGADSEPSARLQRLGWWLGRVCCALCGIIAALGLAGWFTNSPHLASLSPAFPAMAPNTSAALGLSTVAWWLLAARRRPLVRAGQAAAVLVTGIGLLTLLDHAIGPLGVERMLFRFPESVKLLPRSPALPTAVALVAAGVALLLLRVRSRRSIQPSDFAAAVTGIPGLTGLASYVYGGAPLYGPPGQPAHTTMALTTSLALVLLCASVLLARPALGIAGMVLGPHLGGVMARRLLVAAVLYPAFGLLVVGGLQEGFYGAELAASVITTGGLLIGGVMVIVTGLKLDQLDRGRQQAAFEQARLAAIVESSNDAILSATPEGVGLTWNRAAERIYGYAAHEILGDREVAMRVVPPERRGEIGPLLERIRRGERVELETERIRKDGERFHAAVTFSPMLGEGGEVIGISSIVRDITPRVRAEQELRESAERLREAYTWLQTAIDQLPEGVIVLDAAGRVAAINAAALELRSDGPRPRDAWGNESAFEVRRPSGEPVPFEELPLVRAFQRHEVVHGEEFQIRGKGGKLMPVTASAAPLRDDSGKVLGAALVMQDIRALKEAERQREEWISVIAHDLRQPIGIIRFSADLLAHAALPERDRKHVARIQVAAARLDSMIHDLLDASRLEANRLTLHREVEDLPALVERTLEHLAPVIAGHPVSVTRKGALRPVLADRDRVAQVLGNLLSNAVKYGEAGAEIEVAVEDQGEAARVSVANRGQGIPAAELEKLFSRFQRSASGKPGVPGIGLGLYICKGLIEAHGGRIGAESTPGEITRFHFTLPYAPAASASAPAGGPPAERRVGDAAE